MEYQKLISLLDNTQNELSKFRTTIWVEIKNESRGTYNESNQIKFKTSLIRLNLRDFSDAYCNYISGTITITGAGADDAAK